MRHALSLLIGIAVAAVCVLFLHHASSLSLFALTGCGVGICALTRTWAYNLPAVRRASVRLRIRWRRHGASTPVTLEAVPFVRRQLGRVNLMWLSYALIAGWACYDILGDTPLAGAPIERAAAGASSAMNAVAGTSAAIRAMTAVGDLPSSRDLASGITAGDGDRVMTQIEDRGQVMGANVTPRQGDSGCSASSVLEALLPAPPVKEL